MKICVNKPNMLALQGFLLNVPWCLSHIFESHSQTDANFKLLFTVAISYPIKIKMHARHNRLHWLTLATNIGPIAFIL